MEVAWKHLDIKTYRALEIIKKQNIPISNLNLAGGCASSIAIQKVIRKIGKDNDINTIIPQNQAYVQDNPASVAWMAWEYINSDFATDIRNKNLHGLNNIPLGNYIENMKTSFKGINKMRGFKTKSKLRTQQ